MAIYAIGDVHGCYRELRRLLSIVPIDFDEDRLWLVGDLVNRGPDSLRALRWARRCSKRMGDRFQMVLGNHDLRLLAIARGVLAPRASDTAVDVLRSKRKDRLLRWLARRPLAYRHGPYLMVHAGLWPRWSADKALRWSGRIEERLHGFPKGTKKLLRPARAHEAGDRRLSRLRRALEALTSLRMCTVDGVACDYSGPPATAPAGCLPWFEVPGRRSADTTVVCGHWAALGLRLQPGLVALDTGCVWGGALTAVRLDDGSIFSQRAR